jgi:Spy/CpxP family protein refolding chaperone
MRTRLGIAAALALTAIGLPAAAQAQYYGGYGDRDAYSYDYGRSYYGDYRHHDWRDHERWERQRAREERRAQRRWEREHRRYYEDRYYYR